MTPTHLVARLLETNDLVYAAYERCLTAQRNGDKTYVDLYGNTQPTPKRDTKRAAGRNSVTMSRNRNLRGRSFGQPREITNLSVRDRGWPT